MTDKTYSYCNICKNLNILNIDKIKTQAPLCGSCKTPLDLHSLVSEVDSIGLSKMIQKSKMPVVVDFWAPWCGPCKMFAPTFEKASMLYGGKIVFVKVNTENFPEVSAQFNIRGIPTLAIFKNTKEIARQSGAFPIDQLKTWLNQFSL